MPQPPESSPNSRERCHASLERTYLRPQYFGVDNSPSDVFCDGPKIINLDGRGENVRLQTFYWHAIQVFRPDREKAHVCIRCLVGPEIEVIRCPLAVLYPTADVSVLAADLVAKTYE